MSRVYSFLSGVLVSSALAYTSITSIGLSTTNLSKDLYRQISLLDQIDSESPTSQSSPKFEERIFSDTVKDLWNTEFEKGVRWFYEADFSGKTFDAARTVSDWFSR
ncbi:hypothetical protein NEOLI_000752 [Neolecta irregularis DAH-3]|uniref:MICOS complex subunit MIC12 n=1 Tax=Neolecta irregularis (strain DAH-3) TaxID=1198029 RepID=A0A1U7LIS7_NEOID|nr:hypothetical protein NEOLI_000752 [Neolecta irregularis DAH-3]|eukprot:OLL22549.1 hypothetical protein NEOLI_000752 [Neolecta irregularis DAH-3]